MRNIDKIKELEHELERYKKKVADQQKEIARWKYEADRAFSVHPIMNAAHARILLTFGEPDKDGDEIIGWHIHNMEKPDMELLKEWEVHSNDIGGKWTLGMVKRRAD